MTAASISLLRRVRSLGVSWEGAAVAACLPPIFLHVRYQPGIAIAFAGTTVNAYLSDLAVALIVALALASGIRKGFASLWAGRWIWASALAFLLWIFVEVALGRMRTSGYPWHVHAVTAAKFAEYALLAPAVPLVLRRSRDLIAALWALTAWCALASIVGVAQFLGAAIFLHGRLGGRQGSFLVESDFSALAGAVLVVGLIALTFPDTQLGRGLGITAAVSGGVGLILAAAVASVLGLATAVGVLALVLVSRQGFTLRRLAPVITAVAIAAAGVVALRGGDLTSFARFVGTSSQSTQARENTVQTYAHHTLLAWISLQIWKDHPLVGAGWEASGDPSTFEPYLPAAHRRFPTEPALAFPSRAHPYETQNVWVQALADLGIVGLALLVAIFCAAAATAWRAARAGAQAAVLIGLGWAALTVWLLAAQSFVAGIPLDAVLWLAFGFVAVRENGAVTAT